MATYRTIASTETDPQSPVTAELMIALANNPTAIAEGSSGSPTMEVAWHELENVTIGSDAGTITLTTDTTAYRALKVVGTSYIAGIGSTVFSLQGRVGGTWRDLYQRTVTPGIAVTLVATIENSDDANSDSYKVVSGVLAENGATPSGRSGFVAGSVTANPFIGLNTSSGAVTEIRLELDVNNFDASSNPLVYLYGIKRTLP